MRLAHRVARACSSRSNSARTPVLLTRMPSSPRHSTRHRRAAAWRSSDVGGDLHVLRLDQGMPSDTLNAGVP